MANLPDINTADVGIIAFWNAHDHLAGGPDTIDPTDCTGIFTSYSVYDNGIYGYADPNAKGWGGSGRHINLRVKNDGWIIAWIDRTNTFGYPNKIKGDFGESGYKGYYDIIYDWIDQYASTNNISFISYLISLLYNALANKASFTFSNADVGHYCYEFISANVITIASSIMVINGNVLSYFQYTAGTNVYHASVSSSGYSAWGTSLSQFAGNNIINITLSGQYRHGSADVLAKGWIPNSLVDYEIKTDATGNPPNTRAKTCMVIIWS